MSIWYDSTGDTAAFTSTLGSCSLAQSFTVPAGGNQTLNILQVICEAVGFSGVLTMNIDLYADSAGAVGALIANLATNANTPSLTANTPTLVDFSGIIASQTVTGGTRYWIVMSDPTRSGTSFPSNNGTPGDTERSQGTGGGLCNFGPVNNTVNINFFMQIGGVATTVTPTLMKFAGKPGGLPTIAADARGIAIVIHGLNSGTSKDILQMATTVDVENFTGWKVAKLWDWQLDAGPPPSNLKTATALAGHFLSRDITDAARGRAFVSITASDSSVAGAQALYAGMIEWDAVTPV